MNISEIRVGDKKASITGALVYLGEPVVGKGGKRVRIGLKDDSGSVFFTVFGDNAESMLSLKLGTKVAVENGYVTEYAGKPQFNVGRYGSIGKA